MPLGWSILANCDGSMIREPSREKEQEIFGRVQRPVENMDLDTNIPGLGRLPSQKLWLSANAGPSTTTPSHGRRWRLADVGAARRGKDGLDLPPLEGRDVLQFTPPSSPLPHLLSSERGALWAEMEEPQHEHTRLFEAETPAVKGKGKRTKDALKVCVMVPRLSDAERKTYLSWNEEGLGSTLLISSDPGCSVTSIPHASSSTAEQCSSLFPRQKQSSHPSSSSSMPRCSSSLTILHPKRKMKFMDIQEGYSKTAEYEKVIHIPRGGAAPSTSKAGAGVLTTEPPVILLEAPAIAPDIPKTRKRRVVDETHVAPQKRYRTASPPRPTTASYPPPDVPAPENSLIPSTSASKLPCNVCIAAGASCTWRTASTAKAPKRGQPIKSCDQCIKSKRGCVVDTPSALAHEQAGVGTEEEEQEYNFNGDNELDVDDPAKPRSEPERLAAENVLLSPAALNPGASSQLVTPQSSPPSSIHSLPLELDIYDEHCQKKGKARAVDDDDDNVELAGGKDTKHLEGEGGELAKEARTEDVAHSTSSAKILTPEFQEEMDDEALYSVMMEPGANDLGAAWNYEQLWAEVLMIGPEVLRRNLKGYRRALLGSDEWYEGEEWEEWEEDEEDEGNCKVGVKSEDEEATHALMPSGTEDEVTDTAKLNDDHGEAYAGVDDGGIDTDSNMDMDGVDIPRPTELGSPPLDYVVPGVRSENDLPPVTSTSPEPEGRGLTLDLKYPTRPDGEEACCHQCRRKSRMVYMQCGNTECAKVRGRTLPGKRYCKRCIVESYDGYKFVEGTVDTCPACEGICSCRRCTKNMDPYVLNQGPMENVLVGRPVRNRKPREQIVAEKTKKRG